MDTQGATMFNMGQVQAIPVTFQHIQKATRRDMILSRVFHYVIEGWQNHVPGELKLYKNRETELSTENGCLMWEIRVIVPQQLQSQVLKMLHANHPGITQMKAIAQLLLVERTCHSCQPNEPNPSVTPLHPWVWPDSPWKRVHVDFAKPYQGHTFFML